MTNSFGFEPDWEQYKEEVGSNRIQPIKESIQNLDDPEEKMLMIMEALTEDLEIIPDVGNFYTFVYNARTPQLQYDQHPLIACTDVQRWGFRGWNYHWEDWRNYNWNEVAGQLYVVRPSEVMDLRQIAYAYYKVVAPI